MEPLANYNGQVMPLSEVRVPALDRGFLFGDSIYEVFRVYAGRLWLEEDHFARLARSLREVRIEGTDLPRLRRRVHETLQASGAMEATVYIQVTRGVAFPRTHYFPTTATPTELIWVSEYRDVIAEMREKGGGSVTLQPDLRWGRCDVKSTNLLGNILAMQAAKEAGCVEAFLYAPDGTLTEASHSSFFGVLDGVVRTTPLGPPILPGCTRGFVIDLAQQAGLSVEERSLHRDDLPRVSELFLTGTTVEVFPVVRVDAQRIGDGTPGPVTRRLQALYKEAVAGFTRS